MRFSIITLLAATIATANAAAVAERKEAVANPLFCVSLGVTDVATLDILTCSAPTTCHTLVDESVPLLPGILGPLTLTVGVCSFCV